MNKNIGFDLEREKREVSPDDWVFGAGAEVKGIADKVGGIVTALYAWPNPVNGVYPRSSNRINHAIDMIKEFAKKYLPIGVVQRGTRDWMSCASNAPNNELETQHNYALAKGLFSDGLVAWFKEVGFINPENGLFETADAFTSIGSGTTINGNSLRSPIEFVRKNGVIPKSMLPDSKLMDFYTYHDPKRILQAMWDLGEEYLKRVPINSEKVYSSKFAQLLDNLKWDIFDSYEDPVDGDFIKRLAYNYIFLGYGYRLVINENIIEDKKKLMIQLKRAIGEKKVYGIKDGEKYWFVSWRDVEKWAGYPTLKEAQAAVQEVGPNHLDEFPKGGIIGDPTIMDLIFGGKETK